jgi:hypothetical protein
MIILTETQADQVRGATENGAQLVPIGIKGGLFVLPETVIDDPNHAAHSEFLSSLPTRQVGDEEWIGTEV